MELHIFIFVLCPQSAIRQFAATPDIYDGCDEPHGDRQILNLAYCQHIETSLVSSLHSQEYPLYPDSTIHYIFKKRPFLIETRRDSGSPLYNGVHIKDLSKLVERLKVIGTHGLNVVSAADSRQLHRRSYMYADSDSAQQFDPDLGPHGVEPGVKRPLHKSVSAESFDRKNLKILFPSLFDSDQLTSSNPARFFNVEVPVKLPKIVPPPFSNKKHSDKYDFTQSSDPKYLKNIFPSLFNSDPTLPSRLDVHVKQRTLFPPLSRHIKPSVKSFFSEPTNLVIKPSTDSSEEHQPSHKLNEGDSSELSGLIKLPSDSLQKYTYDSSESSNKNFNIELTKKSTKAKKVKNGPIYQTTTGSFIKSSSETRTESASSIKLSGSSAEPAMITERTGVSKKSVSSIKRPGSPIKSVSSIKLSGSFSESLSSTERTGSSNKSASLTEPFGLSTKPAPFTDPIDSFTERVSSTEPAFFTEISLSTEPALYTGSTSSTESHSNFKTTDTYNKRTSSSGSISTNVIGTLSTKFASSTKPALSTKVASLTETASFTKKTELITESISSSSKVSSFTISSIQESVLSTTPASSAKPAPIIESGSSTKPNSSIQSALSNQQASKPNVFSSVLADSSPEPTSSTVTVTELVTSAQPVSSTELKLLTQSISYYNIQPDSSNEPVPFTLSNLYESTSTRKTISNECEVGTTWVMNCYFCMCTDGKANCTRVEEECQPPSVDEPKACKPYTEYSLDSCNKCRCNADGVPICALNICKKKQLVRKRTRRQIDAITFLTNENSNNTFLIFKIYFSKLKSKRNHRKSKKRCWNIKITEDYIPSKSSVVKLNSSSRPEGFPRCKTGSNWKANCFECKCIKSQPDCKNIQNCTTPIYGAHTMCKPGSTIVDTDCASCKCNDDGQKECTDCTIKDET